MPPKIHKSVANKGSPKDRTENVNKRVGTKKNSIETKDRGKALAPKL